MPRYPQAPTLTEVFAAWLMGAAVNDLEVLRSRVLDWPDSAARGHALLLIEERLIQVAGKTQIHRANA